MSDMAMQNQIATRSQFQQCINNIDSIDRNYRMDLNMKNLFEKDNAKQTR